MKGKPGSGKSTLMKFLATHKGTRRKLSQWGGQQRVVLASHFFWIAGESVQKSLTGLWQTLLFQVLKECPGLIESVCPSRWSSESGIYGSLEPWDDNELRITFKRVAEQRSLPIKFCFFIDGLDEYTAGTEKYTGTYTELLEPIKDLASSPSIKICVSSRPWNAFEKALGTVPEVIRLEDLTHNDIDKYVRSELDIDEQFQALSRQDNRFEEIPRVIVQRAEGVFLWVYLVVASLKRGLSNGDTHKTLLKRLHSLPGDLEALFMRILGNVESVYKEDMARMSLTLIASQQTLPLMAFKFLEQASTSPRFAVDIETKPMSSDERKAEFSILNTRVNACCQDLLTCTRQNDQSVLGFLVDFMHRTVRDFFLESNAAKHMLSSSTASDFEPNLALCSMMLALVKISDPHKRQFEDDEVNTPDLISDVIHQVLRYARQLEESHVIRLPALKIASQILDELDRTILERRQTTGLRFTTADGLPWGEGSFLTMAVRAGLTTYVETKLSQNPSPLKEFYVMALLDYALVPDREVNTDPSFAGPQIAIVKLLLQHGADPNRRILEKARHHGRFSYRIATSVKRKYRKMPKSRRMLQRLSNSCSSMVPARTHPSVRKLALKMLWLPLNFRLINMFKSWR